MPTPRHIRQTKSYLRGLLSARGLRPNTKLGQNFLIDLNLMDVLIDTAELSNKDFAIEVGVGTGGMTAQLGERAGLVLGIELDSGFYQLALDNTHGLENVTLVNSDILKGKNKIHPRVLGSLNDLMNPLSNPQLKLVSNLPYVVATPVISNFLMMDLPFERMVVTIQLELAERLTARPSTKDYGGLSVLVQCLAHVEIVRKLRPSVFWPRPKVDSAIVLIRPSADKRAQVGDVAGLRDFLRDLYIHRRKNLRGALWPFNRDRFTKAELDHRLTAGGFDPAGRAEALSVEQHLLLRTCLNQE